MSTEYAVLRDADDERLEVVATGVSATSSSAAIRATANSSGAYVAIPMRSFQPVKVTVATKPTVQIGELA
jgi:hypothetical protein